MCGYLVWTSSLKDAHTAQAHIGKRKEKMPKLIDITGEKYGRLIVVSLAKKVERKYFWNCVCECGNKRVVAGSALRSGHSQSCGCITKDRLIDITGGKFNSLTVLGRSNNVAGDVYWDCVCECGNETTVKGSNLKTGNTKSCGCLQISHIRKLGKGKATHGLTKKEPLYQVWRNMIGRCKENTRKNTKSSYFDRGIRVCKEWSDSPAVFISWAKDNGYKGGLELDREDNDLGYSPGNCRFVTRIANNHNKRVLGSRNTSGYAGVHWRKDTNKFQACIQVGDRKESLGCYLTPWEACQARNKFIIENNLPHKIQELK